MSTRFLASQKETIDYLHYARYSTIFSLDEIFLTYSRKRTICATVVQQSHTKAYSKTQQLTHFLKMKHKTIYVPLYSMSRVKCKTNEKMWLGKRRRCRIPSHRQGWLTLMKSRLANVWGEWERLWQGLRKRAITWPSWKWWRMRRNTQ